MNKTELNLILENHKLWLNDDGGERANLRGSDLSGSDLSGSDLSGSNLRGSDLRGSNLRGSDLSGSDLSYSDLRGSDLRGSNLRGSDLSYSDLRGSDLRGSDLSNIRIESVIGNRSEIKSLQIDTYDISYTDKVMQIGCESHDIKDWWEFDDETINEMETGALDWWKVWKPIIKNIIKNSPAKPTGFK